MTVVLLDRDGVINRNRGDYVKSEDEFDFLPGALEAVARLTQTGCTTVVISNQAGVGRGLISCADLDRINEKMLRGISEHGGELAGLYYCTHRKDEDCDCRKPKAGLFHKASKELGFRLEGSYFIGDTKSDLEAGMRAGCTTILVLTGKSSLGEVESWELEPDYVAADLRAAVAWILKVRTG